MRCPNWLSLRLWLFCVTLLLLAGCQPRWSGLTVADLERVPQRPSLYLDPVTAQVPLVSAENQQALAQAFLEAHFSPWHSTAPLAETRHPFWAVDWLRDHEVFAENLRQLPPGRAAQLIRQADQQSYPGLNRRAVTLQQSDVRALPTHRPLFNNPQQAGEGFPFDALQHGVMAANTPVVVTHQSLDGSWVFVESQLLYGWLPTNAVAWVDSVFIDTFTSGQYLTLIEDELAVFDQDGIFRLRAGIGNLMPLVGSDSSGYQIVVAVADAQQQAQPVKATIAFEHGASFPLALTPQQIAQLAQKMMGQTYGWGGAYGNRDCSATLRDLFAAFGVWLPRNSAQQARVGVVIDLASLTPAQREQQLLERGTPFVTLVRLPGHIMLYLGEQQGRAVVLHTLWGLSTRSRLGHAGRLLVGETVITGLDPGREHTGFMFEVSPLRERITSINLLLGTDAELPPPAGVVEDRSLIDRTF